MQEKSFVNFDTIRHFHKIWGENLLSRAHTGEAPKNMGYFSTFCTRIVEVSAILGNIQAGLGI